MVDACARQLRDAVCPLWGVEYRPINVYAGLDGLPPGTTDPVFLMDTPGDRSVWGSHFRTLTPVARVFVDPVLEDGGGVVLADNANLQRPTVAAVLSHELIEMTVDPDLDRYVLGPGGNEYPVEPADPVQRWQVMGFSDVNEARGLVMLSDFVLPAYYQEGAPGPWNFGRTAQVPTTTPELPGPFTIAPGGYSLVNGDPVYGRRRDGTTVYPDSWVQAARVSKRRARRELTGRPPVYIHP